MKVIWGEKAKQSYAEELEFIFKKWNTKEVEKFMLLVNDYLEKLKSGIIEGKNSHKTGIKSLVISKQTTLFFDVNKTENSIELLLFWNNKRNPKLLKKQ